MPATVSIKQVAITALAFAPLLVVSVASSNAGAKPSRRSHCLPRRAHAVAADRDVRVYSLKATYMAGRHRRSREVTYACLFRNGATLKLTDPETGRPASGGEIALNGPMVAYTYTVTGVDTGQTEIVSADVASRNTLVTVPNAAGFVDGCIIEFREIKDLVVTKHGSVAWILRTGHGCKTETFQVFDATTSGNSTLLEEGPGIDPASLRVLRRSVSWENEGQRHYARLQ